MRVAETSRAWPVIRHNCVGERGRASTLIMRAAQDLTLEEEYKPSSYWDHLSAGPLTQSYQFREGCLDPLCMSAKSLCHVQLCDTIDCSLLGSSAHGILQARILG